MIIDKKYREVNVEKMPPVKYTSSVSAIKSIISWIEVNTLNAGRNKDIMTRYRVLRKTKANRTTEDGLMYSGDDILQPFFKERAIKQNVKIINRRVMSK
jgi:hypothetical protein